MSSGCGWRRQAREQQAGKADFRGRVVGAEEEEMWGFGRDSRRERREGERGGETRG